MKIVLTMLTKLKHKKNELLLIAPNIELKLYKNGNKEQIQKLYWMKKMKNIIYT